MNCPFKAKVRGLLVDAVRLPYRGPFAELYPHAKRVVAAEFLRRVLDKLPYQVHPVLTDNGVQFTPQVHQFLPGGYSYDRICREYGVEHRLTKPAHLYSRPHPPHAETIQLVEVTMARGGTR